MVVATETVMEKRSEKEREAMLPQSQKQAEEAIVSTLNETATDRDVHNDFFSVKSILWHGGSAWDAWFSCASRLAWRSTLNASFYNLMMMTILIFLLQVAQVLLTLPYSFSQMGMLSGIILQIFYGLVGSWTAYLISALYIEYRTRKEKGNVNFKNHVIQWFKVLDGLLGPYCGGLWGLPSTALSSSLDLLSSSLAVPILWLKLK